MQKMRVSSTEIGNDALQIVPNTVFNVILSLVDHSRLFQGRARIRLHFSLEAHTPHTLVDAFLLGLMCVANPFVGISADYKFDHLCVRNV